MQSTNNKYDDYSYAKLYEYKSNLRNNIVREADKINLRYLIIPDNIGMSTINDLKIYINSEVINIPFIIIIAEGYQKKEGYHILTIPKIFEEPINHYQAMFTPFQIELTSSFSFDYKICYDCSMIPMSLRQQRDSEIVVNQIVEAKSAAKSAEIDRVYIVAANKLTSIKIHSTAITIVDADPLHLAIFNYHVYSPEKWTDDHYSALSTVMTSNQIPFDISNIIKSKLDSLLSKNLYSIPILPLAGINIVVEVAPATEYKVYYNVKNSLIMHDNMAALKYTD